MPPISTAAWPAADLPPAAPLVRRLRRRAGRADHLAGDVGLLLHGDRPALVARRLALRRRLFTTVWLDTGPVARRTLRQWAALGFCAGLMMLVREQDALFLALPAVETLAWLGGWGGAGWRLRRAATAALGSPRGARAWRRRPPVPAAPRSPPRPPGSPGVATLRRVVWAGRCWASWPRSPSCRS